MNLQLCIYVQTYSVRSRSLAKCVEASANSQNVVAAGSMGADGDLDQPAAANIGLLKVKFPHLHKRNMWGSLN